MRRAIESAHAFASEPRKDVADRVLAGHTWTADAVGANGKSMPVESVCRLSANGENLEFATPSDGVPQDGGFSA